MEKFIIIIAVRCHRKVYCSNDRGMPWESFSIIAAVRCHRYYNEEKKTPPRGVGSEPTPSFGSSPRRKGSGEEFGSISACS
jgi:hypothetical protein